MDTDNQPGITHDETAHPMETAAPIIAGIAGIAILAILAVAGFTTLEFFLSGAKPAAIAHTQPAPTPPAG